MADESQFGPAQLSRLAESAAFFAQIDDDARIADGTLSRCLEALHCDRGAIWLDRGNGVALHADRNGAAELLAPDVPDAVRREATARCHDADSSRPLLRRGAPATTVVTLPIDAGPRRLGVVAAVLPAERSFDTAGVAVAAVVASQAAIALSRELQHRELNLERQKLRFVVQSQTDGVVVVDRNGRTLLRNPIAREYCGSDEVLPLLTAVDPTCTMQALASGSTERELTLAIGGGRARVVNVLSCALQSSTHEPAGAVLLLRDRTRERRDDRMKRDFLSLVSHKFRTPLTALVCGIEMMQAAEGPERDAFAAEVGRRTHDLSVLVDRLFYFAELLQGAWPERGSTPLSQMGEEVTRHFADRPGTPAIDFVWDFAPDARRAPLPPARLRVALINLVDNAVKFSATPTPWVRIASRRNADGGITIEVEDRGQGIPTAEREQLFAAFHQLDEDFTGNVNGVGIGLAIVREIANRTGGTLAVRDAQPNGTVFSLVFPAETPVPASV